MNPENWFKKMHEATEHPEKAAELAREPRAKRTRKQNGIAETKPPALDYLREWEQKKEERGERDVKPIRNDFQRRANRWEKHRSERSASSEPGATKGSGRCFHLQYHTKTGGVCQREGGRAKIFSECSSRF